MPPALVLGKKDVERLISMPAVIKALEQALRKPFRMPPKVYLDIPEHGGDFRAMPCFQEPYASLKWVSVYPKNPGKGLPTVMATIILCDAATALPLAVMDGTTITAYRTGAIGGLAAKWMASPGSRVMGIVGAGVQARTQLLAVDAVMRLGEVRVFDRGDPKAKKFVADMRGKVKCRIVPAASAEEAVRGADVIATCTTSREPIVFSEWLKEGAHVNAIGADAPGKQELDPEILKRARVVVDDLRQAVHGGEINVPVAKGVYSEKSVFCDIAEVARGAKKPRKNYSGTTVFVSTGLAVQDLAAAGMVYEAAKTRKIGRKLDLA
ncbi:MAG: ornithine cyclodeaminase family protein [Candidatus Micrarchaeota archaeon]|nr:ornithine cyclodeaminase family protein [Candidatus Micrarchaeota archaeon]